MLRVISVVQMDPPVVGRPSAAAGGVAVVVGGEESAVDTDGGGLPMVEKQDEVRLCASESEYFEFC
jgi:3-hydroxy-3-methylglutaryl CoA synthase